MKYYLPLLFPWGPGKTWDFKNRDPNVMEGEICKVGVGIGWIIKATVLGVSIPMDAEPSERISVGSNEM